MLAERQLRRMGDGQLARLRCALPYEERVGEALLADGNIILLVGMAVSSWSRRSQPAGASSSWSPQHSGIYGLVFSPLGGIPPPWDYFLRTQLRGRRINWFLTRVSAAGGVLFTSC